MYAPKHVALIFMCVTLAMIASACGALTLEQTQATAGQLAATSVALTLTALPTNTPAPSATVEPSATASAQPSKTPSTVLSATASNTPTFAPTWTPYGQMAPADFATAQADKADLNAPLVLQNQSGEDQITFILLTPVQQEYKFDSNMMIILPEGTYTYRARIGDKKTLNGSFTITSGDKHILTFYSDKVHFTTP